MTLAICLGGAIILGFFFWFWYDDKKLSERYGGDNDCGYEDNPNSETPLWRKGGF